MRRINYFLVFCSIIFFGILNCQPPEMEGPPEFAPEEMEEGPPGFPMMEGPESPEAGPPEMMGMEEPHSVGPEGPVPDQMGGPEREEPTDVTRGPETLDLPEEKIGVQGNWIKKKEWLKQTQEKNAAIQSIVVDLQGSRKAFFEKFRPVDDELDDFYRQGGFEKGRLENLFVDIEKHLEKSKKKELDLLAIRRDDEVDKEKYVDVYGIEEEFKKRKKDLDQLKLNMNALVDLDASVRTRLKALDEQIAVALQESEKARTFSEEIWYVVDDKKARSFFYDVSGINEKVKSIQEFIKGPLLSDFQTVMNKIKTQISKIQDEIKDLEKQGIVIENRHARLAQLRKRKLAGIKIPTEQEEKERLLALREAAREKEQAVRRPVSWYEYIQSFFSTLYALIFGTAKVPEKPKEPPKVKPVPPVAAGEEVAKKIAESLPPSE